jgi:hypothetical protein
LINVCNAKIDELNSINIISRSIVSIGGGISLDPREFKQTIINKDSPAIREITKLNQEIGYGVMLQMVGPG